MLRSWPPSESPTLECRVNTVASGYIREYCKYVQLKLTCISIWSRYSPQQSAYTCTSTSTWARDARVPLAGQHASATPDSHTSSAHLSVKHISYAPKCGSTKNCISLENNFHYWELVIIYKLHFLIFLIFFP